MKRYTVTANPDIQLATISLLRNLIKLRVNYSLLDHDGVFLRVLRSQIECAEKLIWRISDCEQILPSIFSFLVSISDDTKGKAQRTTCPHGPYCMDEPQNNVSEPKKGIIKRNEIITLLSSLMASGLKTNLIISSMESIVLDIFDSSKKARDPLTSLIHQGCVIGSNST